MRFVYLILAGLLLQPLPLFALTLAGTGDSEVLLQELGAEFKKTHPRAEISVPPSVGSSGGIRLVLEGRSDLARVARALSSQEREKGLHWQQFAVVPIVFVANLPLGCVNDLSSAQILDIFAGRINSWQQLGACPEQKIYLARREEGDSSNHVLYEKIPGLRSLKETVGKIVYTTPETYETLAKHPFTLGYLPLSQVTGRFLTKFTFEGVPATSVNVKSGLYRLHVPLALAWKAPLKEEAQQFLNFLESPEALKIIRAFGAIPTRAQGD